MDWYCQFDQKNDEGNANAETEHYKSPRQILQRKSSKFSISNRFVIDRSFDVWQTLGRHRTEPQIPIVKQSVLLQLVQSFQFQNEKSGDSKGYWLTRLIPFADGWSKWTFQFQADNYWYRPKMILQQLHVTFSRFLEPFLNGVHLIRSSLLVYNNRSTFNLLSLENWM